MSRLHGFDGAAHPRLPLFLPQGRARPKQGHWIPPPGHSEPGPLEALPRKMVYLFLFWRPSVALVPAFPKASSLNSISYLYPSNKLFFSGSSNLCLFLLITSKTLYDHRVWLKINVVCRLLSKEFSLNSHPVQALSWALYRSYPNLITRCISMSAYSHFKNGNTEVYRAF